MMPRIGTTAPISSILRMSTTLTPRVSSNCRSPRSMERAPKIETLRGSTMPRQSPAKGPSNSGSLQSRASDMPCRLPVGEVSGRVVIAMGIDPEHEQRLAVGGAMQRDAGDGAHRRSNDRHPGRSGNAPATGVWRAWALDRAARSSTSAWRSSGRRQLPGLVSGAVWSAAQIAMIGDVMAQIDQHFHQTRHPQRFGPHAGATHRGAGGGGDAQKIYCATAIDGCLS